MNIVVIERESLASKLTDWGVDVVLVEPHLPKARYALVPYEWLVGQFAVDWAAWRSQIMSGYELGAEVCVDYARECACYAARMFRRDHNHPKGAGCCFGEYWYRHPGDEIGDGINLVPVVRGDAIVDVYFQPQTSRLVTLNSSDKNLCQFVRF